jgi:hypothetical protein
MIDPYWFQKKWGFAEPVPSDDIFMKNFKNLRIALKFLRKRM